MRSCGIRHSSYPGSQGLRATSSRRCQPRCLHRRRAHRHRRCRKRMAAMAHSPPARGLARHGVNRGTTRRTAKLPSAVGAASVDRHRPRPRCRQQHRCRHGTRSNDREATARRRSMATHHSQHRATAHRRQRRRETHLVARPPSTWWLIYTDGVHIGITASTQRPNRTTGLIGA